jgi:hypothetical protein
LQFVIYFLPLRDKIAGKGGKMPNRILTQPNAPRAPKLLDRIRIKLESSATLFNGKSGLIRAKFTTP